MDSSVSSLLSGYASAPGSSVQAARPAAGSSTGKEPQEVDRSGKDTLTISDAARQFGKLMAKGRGEVVEDGSESQDPVEKLKKKIEELEQKIAQIEQSEVPEATKQGVVKGMETQLAALRQQLAALMAQTAKSGAATGKA